MAVAPLIPILAGVGKSAGTAAVTAAAIGGGTSLIGGAMASRGANKANDAQRRANDQALTFEREREATRRAEYQEALALQKAQYQARENARLGLLKRYGINVPSGGASGGVPGQASGLTLGRLAAGPAAPTQQLSNTGDWRSLMRPQGRTLGQLANWHEWGGR